MGLAAERIAKNSDTKTDCFAPRNPPKSSAKQVFTDVTYRATATDMQQLLGIVDKLGRSSDSRPLRQSVADDLLALTHADMLASFAWNEPLQQFEDVAFVNMQPSNLARYQQHFQYCDPITSQLQLRRSATLVNSVMAQADLEKTEFYNDFLKVDGLKWGINLYAYDGDLNVGDLRIWRGASRPAFGDREVALLDLLKPHFTNALVNARSLTALRSKVSGWHDLWEHHPNACFVWQGGHPANPGFGNLPIHLNEAARGVEAGLSPHGQIGLRQKMRGMMQTMQSAPITGLAACRDTTPNWSDGKTEFRLSVLRPDDPASTLCMVQINPRPKLVIDRHWILLRFALTPKEADMCLWIMRGLSDQAIASTTKLSIWTVRAHVKSIFSKMQVSARSELTHQITSAIAEIHVDEGRER